MTCVSDVPCVSELQCATLAGYSCNTAVSPKVCQRLNCGTNVACSRDEFCTQGRICRTIDHADGKRCWSSQVTAEECRTSCLTAPNLSDCNRSGDQEAICAELCGRMTELCPQDEGFVDVISIPRCQHSSQYVSVDVHMSCRSGSSSTHSIAPWN